MADNFRDNPSDEEKYKFDPFAHSVTVIQEEHRLVHDGMYFSVNYAFSGLANGASVDIVLSTPVGVFPHLRAWKFALSDGPCAFSLFENPTVTIGGTDLTPVNNNRASSRTAQTTVKADPTITVTGNSLLEAAYVPDPGGGFFTSPGTTAGDVSEEWVLNQNEDYLLRLTNNSGPGTIDGSLYMVFYELQYDH